jgi:hypothetical protein
VKNVKQKVVDLPKFAYT